MGTILPYVGDVKNIPKGWALCDGTNNTPDLTGRFLEGVTTDPKEFKEAALPNITGIFSTDDKGYLGSSISYYQSGAFRYEYDVGGIDAPGNGMGGVWSFDATRCSPVYRNDITTVQPSSYTVYYIMKIKK